MPKPQPQLDYRGKPRSKYQTVNELPSLTVQSERDDADIQVILARFQVEGTARLNESQAMFADITEFTDYADAMRNLRVAEHSFMELPSKVREIFNHDVAEWLDASHDPEKRDALIAAGYLDGPESSGPASPPSSVPATEADPPAPTGSDSAES